MANGEITYDTRSRKSIIFFIISIIVLSAVILGGAFYYKQFMTGSNALKETKQNKKVTPTPTNSPTPTPTKVEIDKSKYSIKILNGSGTSGEAGRAKTYLEEEGFDVSSVGNADKFDYQKSVLEVSKDIDEDFLTELKSFISKKYPLEDTAETVTGEETITLIIGEDKIE